MFDGHLRTEVDKRTGPIGAALAKTPLSADSLTIIGIVFSIIAGIFIAQGEFGFGLVLLVFGGIPDLLDGPLAKVKGTSSKRGAFFDSFSDRVSDLFLFGGLGWYFSHSNRPELAVLPFAVYGAASLISYQRAKAESLGFNAKGGIMERAERLVLLGFGLLFSSLLVPILWITLVLSAVTVIQRFVKVWSQASSSMARAGQISRRSHGGASSLVVQSPEFFRQRTRSYRVSHPRRKSSARSSSSSFSRWLEQRGSRSFRERNR